MRPGSNSQSPTNSLDDIYTEIAQHYTESSFEGIRKAFNLHATDCFLIRLDIFLNRIHNMKDTAEDIFPPDLIAIGDREALKTVRLNP